MYLLDTLFYWRHSGCVIQEGRYLHGVYIASHKVNWVLRAPILLITVICYVEGVSLRLWQHSVGLRAVKHLFKVDRGVERLCWILTLDLSLTPLHGLSHHLLVCGVVRVLLLCIIWLLFLAVVCADFDEPWLTF